MKIKSNERQPPLNTHRLFNTNSPQNTYEHGRVTTRSLTKQSSLKIKMKSKIIRQITIAISALLIMNSAAISAEAILFKIFNDPEMKNPRADEPFLIFLDGHLTDKGITNEKGQIITKNRNPGEMQQFVMKILGFGTYTVTFNLEKNKQKPLVRRISREYEFAPTWTYQCMTKPTGAQVAHTGYNYSEPLEISK